MFKDSKQNQIIVFEIDFKGSGSCQVSSFQISITGVQCECPEKAHTRVCGGCLGPDVTRTENEQIAS